MRKGMSLEIFPILLHKLKYPIVENETVKEIPINDNKEKQGNCCKIFYIVLPE